ncbi:hypothetical protein TKK_0017122 [Trichogramma kaykai]
MATKKEYLKLRNCLNNSIDTEPALQFFQKQYGGNVENLKLLSMSIDDYDYRRINVENGADSKEHAGGGEEITFERMNDDKNSNKKRWVVFYQFREKDELDYDDEDDDGRDTNKLEDLPKVKTMVTEKDYLKLRKCLNKTADTEEALKIFRKHYDGNGNNLKILFMSFNDIEYIRINVENVANLEELADKDAENVCEIVSSDDESLDSNSSGNKKKYKIVSKKLRRFKGRTYRNNGKPKGCVTYYKCTTKGCPATAKIVEGIDQLVPIKEQHLDTCTPQERIDSIIELEEFLQNKIQDSYYKSNDLWKEAIEKCPKATEIVDISTMRPKMKKWRSNKFPAKAKNIGEFVKQINNGDYNKVLSYYDFEVSAQPVMDAKGMEHVLLYDKEFIKKHFENCTHLFIDGTFKTRPDLEDCVQLLIIMGVLSGCAVPLFYVAMTKRTHSAYEAVLNHVLQVHHFNKVKIIMSDFEGPLRSAIQSCLTMGKAVGCNFHFDKAILLKLRKLGLQTLLNKDDDFVLLVKKFLCVAFLPPEMIEDEFERQSKIFLEFFDNKLADGEIKQKEWSSAFAFIEYFDSYWMKVVTPAGFSVFALSKRTNNCCESFNSLLQRELDKRPVVNIFCQKIVELALKYRKRVKLDENLIPSHCDLPRYESTIRTKLLFRHWKLIKDPEANHPIETFITAISSTKGNNAIRATIKSMEEDKIEPHSQLAASLNVGSYENDPDVDRAIIEDDETLQLEKKHFKALKAAEHTLQKQNIQFSCNSTEIENLLKKKEFKNSKRKDPDEGLDEGKKHANIAVDIIEESPEIEHLLKEKEFTNSKNKGSGELGVDDSQKYVSYAVNIIEDTIINNNVQPTNVVKFKNQQVQRNISEKKKDSKNVSATKRNYESLIDDEESSKATEERKKPRIIEKIILKKHKIHVESSQIPVCPQNNAKSDVKLNMPIRKVRKNKRRRNSEKKKLEEARSNI